MEPLLAPKQLILYPLKLLGERLRVGAWETAKVAKGIRAIKAMLLPTRGWVIVNIIGVFAIRTKYDGPGICKYLLKRR
jgi:hypothetical protein